MKLDDLLKTIFNYGMEGSLDEMDATIHRELEPLVKVPYIYNILYNYMSECFEEGYYGNPSMQDDYINHLNQVIYEDLGPLKNFMNINAVLSRVPSFIFNILTSGANVFLAGGGALKVILDIDDKEQDWIGDWDIYCDERHLNSVVSSNFKMAKGYNADDSYGTMTYICDKYKIQVIPTLFNSPVEILERFDLTLCQFAISKNMPCIYGTDNAFKDLQGKIINLNPNLHPSKINKENLKDRIDKYTKRGFKISNALKNFITKIPVKPQEFIPTKKKKGKNQLGLQPAQVAQVADWFAPAGQVDINEDPNLEIADEDIP